MNNLPYVSTIFDKSIKDYSYTQSPNTKRTEG